MIQRIQSVWLLLAALCCLSLFFFDVYHANIMVNGAATTQYIRVNDHYPSLLIAILVTIMPLGAIFLYKDRKRQRSISIFAIVAIIGFITITLSRVTKFNTENPTATDASYWIGAVMPAIAIIFLILAIRGINKDEKLVKSLDRLR